jgi:hypothetical protein
VAAGSPSGHADAAGLAAKNRSTALGLAKQGPLRTDGRLVRRRRDVDQRQGLCIHALPAQRLDPARRLGSRPGDEQAHGRQLQAGR